MVFGRIGFHTFEASFNSLLWLYIFPGFGATSHFASFSRPYFGTKFLTRENSGNSEMGRWLNKKKKKKKKKKSVTRFKIETGLVFRKPELVRETRTQTYLRYQTPWSHTSFQSLWRKANARNVSLLTLYGGQFTFSTQLLTLNYLLWPKLVGNAKVWRLHLVRLNSI